MHHTSTTFTHRERRVPRTPTEPAVCPGCGAVYVKRRWSRSPAARARVKADSAVTVRVCRGCRQRTTGVPHGYLHIDGEFFPEHRTEIERLLHNEVDRAREDNPLHQVIAWEDFGGGTLLITTSTEHLAQRLGHALEKAYDGEVLYGFSHQNKLAHVWWHR